MSSTADSEAPAAWQMFSPAPRIAALSIAGAHARVRRLVLKQVRTVDSLAIYRDADAMAVAMFDRFGWRRVEMALAVSPAAAPHMRRLVRIAQLTLPTIAQDRLVVIRIHPANRAGRRMAMLAGFRPARLKQPGFWVFRGTDDGGDSRRRGEEGSAEGAGTAARRE